MPKNHRLKTVNPFFEMIWSGEKSFDIRKNDRDYQIGDEIRLAKYDAETGKCSVRADWFTIIGIAKLNDLLKLYGKSVDEDLLILSFGDVTSVNVNKQFMNLIQLAKDNKPNDRSADDRYYAVLITMLEQAYAYYVAFCTNILRKK